MRDPFIINDISVEAGTRQSIDLPVAQLYTHTPLHVPIEVIHGKREGPKLLVCAAIHGDEINGVEVIRRILNHKSLKTLKGTLIAVPIVNVFGFIHKTRYLPDRRDLNRVFPGGKRASLAGRFAYRFKTEIVDKCTHVIDLHTGALHRSNLPQIRASLANPTVSDMAHSFGLPVIINAPLIDGSLRYMADTLGIPVITYEAGEALRFEETAIKAGVKGIINVMRSLGMLRATTPKKTKREPFIAKSSSWTRAEMDGIFRPLTALGARVKKGDTLGVISDPYGAQELPIHSSMSGIIIGRNNLPLINEGEALFHIARFEEIVQVAKEVEKFHDDMAIDDKSNDEEPPIL